MKEEIWYGIGSLLLFVGLITEHIKSHSPSFRQWTLAVTQAGLFFCYAYLFIVIPLFYDNRTVFFDKTWGTRGIQMIFGIMFYLNMVYVRYRKEGFEKNKIVNFFIPKFIALSDRFDSWLERKFPKFHALVTGLSGRIYDFLIYQWYVHRKRSAVVLACFIIALLVVMFIPRPQPYKDPETMINEALHQDYQDLKVVKHNADSLTKIYKRDSALYHERLKQINSGTITDTERIDLYNEIKRTKDSSPKGGGNSQDRP